MYPQQELQRQLDMERGRAQQEEIPLHQIKGNNVDPEAARIEQYRRIFDEYDRDNDGYLDTKEIKRMIKAHTCDNFSKGAARKILQMSDLDNNGKIGFDEFYEMAQIREAYMRTYAVQYCTMVVPKRDPIEARDETDGAYEVTFS